MIVQARTMIVKIFYTITIMTPIRARTYYVRKKNLRARTIIVLLRARTSSRYVIVRHPAGNDRTGIVTMIVRARENTMIVRTRELSPVYSSIIHIMV